MPPVPERHHWSRAVALIVAALLLLVPAGPAHGDLDVGAPPGTPDDWNRRLPRPTVTGRGKVPARTSPTPATPDTADPGMSVPVEPGPGEDRPPTRIEAMPAINNATNFRILTMDLIGHIGGGLPNQPPGPVTTTPSADLDSDFPPPYPPELFWDGVLTCLRKQLHPEVVSELAATTHLIAIGQPAVVGAERIAGSQIPALLKNAVPPGDTMKPQPPRGNTAYETLVNRLATLELSADWPGASNPMYGRRILSLGDDAVTALIACSQSRHKTLSRAAVWALGGFDTDAALARLYELCAPGTDMVERVRAYRALIRQKDVKAVDVFRKGTTDTDEVIRSLAWQGIGAIGDTKMMPQFCGALTDAMDQSDTDMLTTLLAVAVRIRPDANDRRLTATLRSVASQITQRLPGKDLPQPAMESIGFRWFILRDRVLMALAAVGYEPSVREFTSREAASFHQVNWYLWCDGAHALRFDAGMFKKLEEHIRHAPDPTVGVHALSLFAQGGRADFLEEVALGDFDYTLRSQALLSLISVDLNRARNLCRRLLRAADMRMDLKPMGDGAAERQRIDELAKSLGHRAQWINDRRTALEKRDVMWAQLDALRRIESNLESVERPGRAWYLSTLLMAGGRIGAWRLDDLAPMVQRGLAGEPMTAWRHEENVMGYPVISTFPPLFDAAVQELGRTGDPDAIPLLLQVMRTRRVSGAPEAAVGLGNFRSRNVIGALIETLMADDPWLRLCAYNSLKTISGEDWATDWLTGNRNQFAGAAKKYRQWMDTAFK